MVQVEGVGEEVLASLPHSLLAQCKDDFWSLINRAQRLIG